MSEVRTHFVHVGIPPQQEDRIRRWLDHVFASLVLSGEQTYEAAVFIQTSYRRAGIGSLLGEATLEHAQAAGAERVWLRYERGNRGATAFLSPYLEHGLKNDAGDLS